MTLQTKQTLSDTPLCSVCIANYNGIGFIDKCINSIIEQDCEFPIEIIIHDDASNDKSVEFICEHYPDAQLIVSNKNVGFCVSNNRMVEKARGKYILLLNNDAELFPDALRELFNYAEQQKKSGILGLRQFNAASDELIDFGVILDPFMNSIPNRNLSRNHVAMMIGACMWMPKSLWKATGGFPKWFHTMHEDMYICCMARLYGYPVQMINSSGYKHWVGKSLGGGKVAQYRLSTNMYRRALSERNRIYVMAMCYPNPVFAFILPVHLMLLLFEGIVLAVIKRDVKVLISIYLSSMGSFWRKRKKIFSIRNKIQKKRVINCKMFLSAFNLVPHKLSMLIKHGFPEIT